MKIIYMGIIRTGLNPNSKPGDKNPDTIQLCGQQDLSQLNYFKRGQIAPLMMFNVHTVAGRTKPGQRQDLEQASYTFHGYSRTEGIAGVIVTDDEYPSLVAHQILSKIVDEFLTKYPRASAEPSPTENSCPFPSSLEEYIKKYDDPNNADSIMKIQQELDSTKIVLHKTIESVLQRGENLDELLDKSAGLSKLSQDFYKSAKDKNSCCIVM